MSTPILFRLSQEAQNPPTPPSSPAPMHLNLNEKVDEYAERLFKNYTAEQNAIHLRETPNSEAIRLNLICRYKKEGQYKAALEVAIETQDLIKRKDQLDTLIPSLVQEDAFTHINRLVEAIVLERRDATKYKVGVAYAERGNFLRAFETYFYISRMEWRNRLFLSVMRYVPDEQKGEFFTQILVKLLNGNEVEHAVDAVKKYPRVDSQALFFDIANYLLKAKLIDKIGVVLNELPRDQKLQFLEAILKPLLINGMVDFALKITEPLKYSVKDPLFYEEVVFNMGKFMISINQLNQIQLIKDALDTKQTEFTALIPPQPMLD